MFAKQFIHFQENIVNMVIKNFFFNIKNEIFPSLFQNSSIYTLLYSKLTNFLDWNEEGSEKIDDMIKTWDR